MSSWNAERDPPLSEAVFLQVFTPSPAAHLVLGLDAARPSKGTSFPVASHADQRGPWGLRHTSPPPETSMHLTCPLACVSDGGRTHDSALVLIAYLSARDPPRSQSFPRGEIPPAASPAEKELGAHFA